MLARIVGKFWAKFTHANASTAPKSRYSIRERECSARFNLLCGLTGERELGIGRREDQTALDKSWDEKKVYEWLCDDQFPHPRQLSALVRFRTERLATEADPTHWEAFLIYGRQLVRPPLSSFGDDVPGWLLSTAAETLAMIVRDYQVLIDSFDLEKTLRDSVEYLKKLNLQRRGVEEDQRRSLAAALFPDSLVRGGS